MKNTIKSIGLISLIGLIGLIRPISAHAEPILSVAPAIINVTLSPGQTYRYTIQVKNLLTVPLPLTAHFDSFDMTEDGTTLLSQDPSSSLAHWSRLEKSDLIIPAKEIGELTLVITLPEKIPFGGYHSLLLLDPIFDKEHKTAVSAQVGVLMLANIGTSAFAQKPGVIADFKTDSSLYQEGPIHISFRFKNTGISNVSAKSWLVVKPMWGTSRQIPLEEKFVFPGKSRLWNKSIELPDYWHGVYTLTLFSSTGNGQIVSTQKTLVAFPLTYSLLTIVAIGVIIVLIRKRANMGRAARALLGN